MSDKSRIKAGAEAWPRRLTESRGFEGAGVLWEGTQFRTHSLAIVNQELCSGLIRRGVDLGIRLYEEHEFTANGDARLQALEDRFQKAPVYPVAVHVRHQWPPVFERPERGKWVMIQPWEYGFIPQDWRQPMCDEVDEIWVPSRYARQCYIDSGIPGDKVFVIPNGVDITRFHPSVAPAQLSTTKSFRFLFVGGTIPRKGIKLLLETYRRFFKRADDVCLVIKDMGRKGVYQGSTAHDEIQSFIEDPEAPEIEYIDSHLRHEQVAGLYRAADVLVHPYHGEGFGMPMAEAMACGIPVIATGLGAAMDFCNQDNAYLIPATRHDMPNKMVGDLEACGFPWIANPDPDALGHLMRDAVLSPSIRQAKGRAARETIEQEFTWDNAVDCVLERLRALAGANEAKAAPITSETMASSTIRAAGEKELLQMIQKGLAGVDPHIRLSDLYYREGRLDEAADLLALALKIDNASPAVRSRAEALLNCC